MARRLVLIVFAVHAIGAGAWFWLMPGGWPVDAARFWVNQAWPLAMLVASLAGIVALAATRDRVVLAIALALAAQWAGVAVAALVVFPASGTWLTVRALVPALGVAATLIPWRAEARRWHLAPAALGLAIGAALTWAERAPAPATRALDVAPPALPADAVRASGVLELRPGVWFAPAAAAVRIAAPPLELDVAPLLSFTSRSPDGGWVMFADARDRWAPPRSFDRIGHHGGEAIASYTPDAVMQVTAHETAVDIAGFTHVAVPTYSHLNTFARLAIAGHERLFLAFSPAPDTRIEVTHADYPTGNPATFACLGADGVFRVLRGASGEKGPFTELAAGPLAKGAPLSFVLYDEDEAIARVTLDDWSAQLDTRPSPTAGWGVPVNAIELGLAATDPRSPAAIFVTLAATSVGRGFDSVGHAPGTYRNRIRVERLR
ncbi:MAG TPA: hypothetical protein VM513_34835 [Kofleriaceae bacterium]|nr:hypothetical protein [Kofleriaceae bacterium]